MSQVRVWVFLLAAGLVQVGSAEPRLELSIDTDKVHAGLPFTLTATVRGFEEEPVPAPPEFDIPGTTVKYVGVSPNVRTQLQIVNGRRAEWREVSFSYRWRVTAPEAREYIVPALTISQDDLTARSRAASFVASEIETTDDMLVRLRLPSRTVWAGESFDVTIEWLLLREVQNFEFSIPLFDVEGVRVLPRDAPGARRLVPFDVGNEQTDLPLVSDGHRENSTDYTRVQFPARVVLSTPGTFELDPVRVAAELVFPGRDRFGFSNRRTQLYTAQASPHRLVVAPLPNAGRPASFVNAIGSGFALDVAASKTVVAAGEPIELTLTIRGTGLLEGLSLPRLDGPGGLEPGHFGLLDAPNVGIDRDGAREFQAVVRVVSPDVREIPSLPFSYFDPDAAEYRTVYSDPIALSVRQGSVVDAADVASAAPRAELQSLAEPSGTPRRGLSLSGANMALGPLMPSRSRTDLVPYSLAALYVLPLLILGFLFYRRRTEAERDERQTIRDAERSVDAALALSDEARTAAPAIVNAVRELARVLGRRERIDELEAIEQSAFNPAMANAPVDEALKAKVRDRMKSWLALLLIVGGLSTTDQSFVVAHAAAIEADSGATAQLSARSSYAEALETGDRTERLRRFAQAEAMFRELVEDSPANVELLTDWGNAAMGAENLGVAVLAYRRALALNPGNDRARANLAWVRDRMPVWLPRPEPATIDTLLFWRQLLSTPWQLVLGAIAFAAAVISLTPRVLGREGSTVGTSILFALWLVFVVPVWLDTADNGVVLSDGITLRAADSVGAPAAFANPLPAGTEVTLLERRGGWARVALSDGSVGWMTDGAIASVRQR